MNIFLKWIGISVLVGLILLLIYFFGVSSQDKTLLKEKTVEASASPVLMSTPISNPPQKAPESEIDAGGGVKFEKIESLLKGERWVKDLALGSAIRDPEDFRLKELTLLYYCKLETTDGKPFQYYSASSVCDGYGVKGAPSGLYLASSLVDASFQPLYLCHTKKVLLYNTLNRSCDRPEDQMNGVLGYVKKND